ncbi:MAG: ZIP family metal transporter, partial [bacterium]
MLLTIIIATLIVSLLSFAGILVISAKKERVMEFGVSLAVGAMLAAVFINIIPELFSDHNNNPELYSIIIMASILIFFVIERFFHWHHCRCHPKTCEQCAENHKHIGWINIFGDGLHNFVDGMIIGVSFMISWKLGLISTIAIAMHEIPQEIGDFSILIRAGFTKAKALMWNFISAILAVAGGIFAYIFASAASYANILMSIAAGSFLYLVMTDIMPMLHLSKRKHHN